MSESQQRLDKTMNPPCLAANAEGPAPLRDWAGSTFVEMVETVGSTGAKSRPGNRSGMRDRVVRRRWSCVRVAYAGASAARTADAVFNSFSESVRRRPTTCRH